MKLAGIAKPLRSVQLRVMLSGDLSASLERYAKYCEHVDSMDPSGPRSFARSPMQTVTSELGHALAATTGRDTPKLRPHPTPAPRSNRDWHQRKVGGRASHVFRIDTSLIAGMNANGASTRKHYVDAVYRNTCEAVQVPAKSA